MAIGGVCSVMSIGVNLGWDGRDTSPPIIESLNMFFFSFHFLLHNWLTPLKVSITPDWLRALITIGAFDISGGSKGWQGVAAATPIKNTATPIEYFLMHLADTFIQSNFQERALQKCIGL